MIREYLPNGHILYPGGDIAAGGYQIVRQIGSGGFGVTYEAVKLPAHGGLDRSATLWLEPMARVTVKEFYPEEIAEQDGSRIGPSDEDGAAEMFDRALHRFRREAERLYFLSHLRVLRAALTAATPGMDDALVAAITTLVTGGDAAQRDRNTGQSRSLIERLDAPMKQAAITALEHSPLPTVYDYFNTPRTAYYVMEFLGGGTLKDRMRSRREQHGTSRIELSGTWFRVTEPLGERPLRLLADSALDALDELHNGIPGQQLVHCDLKPGNIMFRRPGSEAPVLIDFGLARNTVGDSSRSMAGGTSGYAPVEIDVDHRRHSNSAGGGAASLPRVGPWTDIYSLAVMLRVLATGIEGNAVPSAYERSIALRLGDDDPLDAIPPYPPGLPGRFAAGIQAGLAIAPGDRPATVAAWRQRLGLERQAPPVPIDDWSPTRSTASERPPAPHPVTPTDVNPVPAPPPTPPVHDGLVLTTNHLVALGIGAALVLVLFMAIFVIDRGDTAANTPESAPVATTTDDPGNSMMAAGQDDPAAATVPDTLPAPVVAATPGATVAPQTLPTPKARVTEQPQPVVVAPPPSVAVPQQTRRYAALGLTVQTITDPTRLAEWRNQGMSPSDAVRVIDIDDTAPRVSEAVHLNDIFVSACGGGSALGALAAANGNRKGCVLTDSESAVRFN